MTGLEAAKKWVASGAIAPRKTINRNFTSYWLKHVAEKEMDTYISNGELIQAMEDAGYTAYQTMDMKYSNSPNYLFNVRLIKR